MTRTLLIALAVALVTPFAAIADPDVLGVPDSTCQTAAEMSIHDYGAPGMGRLAALPVDGNLEPCPSAAPSKGPSGVKAVGHFDCDPIALDPATTFLCEEILAASFDGDNEYAETGAALVAESGDGVNSGGIACWGVEGHHPVGGSIYVTDLVALNVTFLVTADFTDPLSPVPPGEVDCGDGVIQPCDPTPPQPADADPPLNIIIDIINALLYELLNAEGATCTPGDNALVCLNHCTPTFDPGADGAYHVLVIGTLDGDNDGAPTLLSGGHIVS